MVALPTYNTQGLLQTGIGTYTVSNVLAANVPEQITVPTDDDGIKARYVVFGKAAAADFFAEAFTTSEGVDKATNGTFAADTDWTKGSGWTIGSGVATAAGAISTALSQTSATALIQGQAYYVTYTATRSAGTVTINIGGTAGTARSTSATFSEYIVAGATQDISFTTSGFTGTVDTLTIIPSAVVPIDSTTGLSAIQNPTGFYLSGNCGYISIVSAGTPVITTSFFK
jgi:hypothetical protein